jgi:hypothetical protein
MKTLETMNLVSKTLPRKFIKINVCAIRGSVTWEKLLRGQSIYDYITGITYSRKDWGW